MKISLNWLKEYYQTDLSAQQISEALTGCGLEVESMETFESLPGGLRGVVIGQVMECAKHPNADKLSLTKVDVGGAELLSIVCGAPNVAAGQKVVVATVGAMLHPVEGEPFEIKKSKIRGELSEGMICAEDEIGLGKSHAGIIVLDEDAKVGTPAAEHFGISSDTVFEIGLTPNRVDAASHFGVARDLAAVVLAQKLIADHNAESNSVSFPAVASLTEELPASPIEVVIEDAAACKRYSGITVSVKVEPSPDWLQNRLKAIGLRPINNIVDITNYVMHETGQPLHAFDAARIKGNKVVIRKCAEGTEFITLDEVKRKLTANDLMICNESEPMCIAGVFGGLDSGVTESTTKIFLESAAFDSVSVRKTSKHHQLKTDSSFRFERGSDPEITVNALLRAVYLIDEIGAGNVTSQITDQYPGKKEAVEIAFSFDTCDTLIGKTIDRSIIRKILTALGMEIISDGKDALLLSVPQFKVDVTRAADVVEEVLRVYGYNNIGFPDKLQISASHMKHPDPEKLRETVSDLLASRGFREILNNSLTRTAYYGKFAGLNSEDTVQILNPLSSDLGVMRMTLLFGGLESITYNVNRKNADQRLFEFGKVYRLNNAAQEGEWKWEEREQLLVLLSGNRRPESWEGKSNAVSFGDIRREAEVILNRMGITGLTWEAGANEIYAESMRGMSGKREVVRIGVVSPKALKLADTPVAVYAAEFEWSEVMRLLRKQKAVRYTEVSKFPAVRRDLALVIDRAVKYQQIEELAWNTERKLLREVNLFDVYEGDKLGEGKKSYAVSFMLQDNDATLTDKQIEKTMERLQKAFEEKVGAVIRS